MIEEAVLFDDLDPDQSVEVQLFSHNNAGRSPNTGWGRIEFDDDGYAELECKVSDLPSLDELKWLLPDDRRRFGLVAKIAVEKPEKPTIDADMSAQNDSLAKENIQLQSKLGRSVERQETLEADNLRLSDKVASLQKESDLLKTSLAEIKKKKSKDKKKKAAAAQ